MKRVIYKAVIIGCGNAAGGYDCPKGKNVFTHAHALSIHGRTILSGVYDIDYRKAVKFSRKWKTVPFGDLDSMFITLQPDLVYVCVPTAAHIKTLRKILDWRPKAVICEKPLGHDVKAAEGIVREYSKKKIPLAVNYPRRFSVVTRKIKSEIAKEKYGKFINASLIYTKGIRHNGSHAIDLLRFFFGEVRSFEILGANFDYEKNDPTLDLFLKFQNNRKAHLVAADEKSYSVFEADFLFSKARIRLENSGLKYVAQKVRMDPLFKGYRDLSREVRRPTDARRALSNLIDNVIQHLERGRELFCSGLDAIKTAQVCDRMIKAHAENKKGPVIIE